VPCGELITFRIFFYNTSLVLSAQKLSSNILPIYCFVCVFANLYLSHCVRSTGILLPYHRPQYVLLVCRGQIHCRWCEWVHELRCGALPVVCVTKRVHCMCCRAVSGIHRPDKLHIVPSGMIKNSVATRTGSEEIPVISLPFFLWSFDLPGVLLSNHGALGIFFVRRG